MQLVVDANVIIAMLIRQGKSIGLLFREDIETFAPQLMFEEIGHNKEEIMQKSSLDCEEFNSFLNVLKNRLNVVPEEEFARYREKATLICPDPKDVIYFALAMHLKCPIWTNEKKLKEQDDVEIYATHELLNTLKD